MSKRELFRNGRIVAPPAKLPPKEPGPTGLHKLKLDSQRDGLLYVPAGYSEHHPAPVALMLHGAGGNAEQGMHLLQAYADNAHIIIVAPDSRSSSWDIISFDRFGPDVVFINQALAQTFDQYVIDPAHIAIGGFSDGASYALSLGLINGFLFTHIIAFSPGFSFAPETSGKPQIFISHGTKDEVLPINSCSRRLVPKLQQQGYKVTYDEFEGPHTIPAYISERAVKWFLAP